MGKIGAKILYLVIIVAFISSAIIGMTFLDDITQEYMFVIWGFTVPVTERLFSVLSFISKVFTTGVLLVLINLYNASKRDTAITQGTLDAKQNQSLSNDVKMMSAQKYIIKNNFVGDEIEKNTLLTDLDKGILESIDLAKTRVDISSAPLQTQIDLKQRFLDNMEEQLKLAVASGDISIQSTLNATIKTVTSEIQYLYKNR